MSVPGQAEGQLVVYGALRGIDLVSRELSLQGDVEQSVIYVPPGCPIRLNGDSVRLRLTQPGDSVEIAVRATSFGWLAERIEIRRPADLNQIESAIQSDSK
jgi:hypothetical protein